MYEKIALYYIAVRYEIPPLFCLSSAARECALFLGKDTNRKLHTREQALFCRQKRNQPRVKMNIPHAPVLLRLTW